MTSICETDGLGSAAGGKSIPNMSRQKSSSSLSAPVTIAQQLRSLFGGHSDAKHSYNDANFDELGVWSPDKVIDILYTIFYLLKVISENIMHYIVLQLVIGSNVSG